MIYMLQKKTMMFGISALGGMCMSGCVLMGMCRFPNRLFP
jgi:hypothetical protein